MPGSLTNIAKEYMRITYSPKDCKGRESVKHLVSPESKFIAPTTFPLAKTCMDYAEIHKDVMECIPDLKITSFDCCFESGNLVCIRYSAKGSHIGKDYHHAQNIPPTGRKAKWTAAMIFEFNESGKISKIYKEWDKLAMWEQLGWPIADASEVKFTKDTVPPGEDLVMLTQKEISPY